MVIPRFQFHTSASKFLDQYRVDYKVGNETVFVMRLVVVCEETRII